MGSSAKKKKEKKKDFQKPKLKFGKAKPKASNLTDTSFKAKSIVINKQSISTVAPTPTAQFSHHLSLLTHRSDGQRRDSLAYLTTALKETISDSPLPQPVPIILAKVQPLILDGSNAVRQQAFKLFKTIPTENITGHGSQLLLYTRAGMTHLASDIRSFSMDMLQWLVETVGEEVVSGPGGWVKTLQCFLSVLGWHADTGGNWSSSKAAFGKAGESKITVKQLNTLATFLKVGMALPNESVAPSQVASIGFPIWNDTQHMIPKRSNCFAQLNLFGNSREEDTDIYDDMEDRRKVFDQTMYATIIVGLDRARQEGGEIGRAAGLASKVILEAMVGFEDDMV